MYARKSTISFAKFVAKDLQDNPTIVLDPGIIVRYGVGCRDRRYFFSYDARRSIFCRVDLRPAADCLFTFPVFRDCGLFIKSVVADFICILQSSYLWLLRLVVHGCLWRGIVAGPCFDDVYGSVCLTASYVVLAAPWWYVPAGYRQRFVGMPCCGCFAGIIGYFGSYAVCGVASIEI